MRVGIVTDSTASLAADDSEREGIEVVPLQVSVDNVSYAEGVDLSADAIAEALQDGHQVTTSRPSPRAFDDAYARLAEQGSDEIVSIHLSGDISGTVECARTAAASSAVPVRVVDTRSVGLSVGFAAGRAARAVRDGADAISAGEAAMENAASSTVLLYVDSLEYLKRGGRVSVASALISSALAVKPVLTVADGTIVALEKIRTQSKALARVEELIVERSQECADGFQIGVQHLANKQRAEYIAEQLAAHLSLDTVPVNEVGAVIAAHVGPGTIAVTLSPR